MMTSRTFLFLWIGRSGPVLRSFDSVHVFAAYVHQARDVLGWDAIEFRTPRLCVGVVA